MGRGWGTRRVSKGNEVTNSLRQPMAIDKSESLGGMRQGLGGSVGVGW